MARAVGPSQMVFGSYLGRCPRLVWWRAVGPSENITTPRARAKGPTPYQTGANGKGQRPDSIPDRGKWQGPKARLHTRPGQMARAKGPTPYQTGANGKGQRPDSIPDRGKWQGQKARLHSRPGKWQGPKARLHTRPGQMARAKGPTPYQTGARPREKTSTQPVGLKARPIPLLYIKLTQSGEILFRSIADLAQIERSFEERKKPAKAEP